ncbi:MAG: hypothetical protein CSB48_02375 [Proteobacteria bacterium]|nr:MAG: hypothetical protein CSB48_02375 [Pseudomonadota bacterium]
MIFVDYKSIYAANQNSFFLLLEPQPIHLVELVEKWLWYESSYQDQMSVECVWLCSTFTVIGNYLSVLNRKLEKI